MQGQVKRAYERALVEGATGPISNRLYRDALGAVPPSGLPEAFIADVPDAMERLVRRYARTHGPFRAVEPARRLGLPVASVEPVLERLGVRWSARDDLGKVSVVGAGMKSHPGVAAKTFATLEAAGIEAPIVSTSPIKIACHVPSTDVDRAVQALHEAFDLA